ncbi:hypothetical protein IQ07DRAFT_112162 [Pyrenochaeta sp. DS3sAY3a]|nr:hypothetical protein IQ07DRAFT_112162 [Pyrenochaeta sp. DS3sAY3a]
MSSPNLTNIDSRSAYELAFSATKVRSGTRDNDLLFSKSNASHLVEFTEFDDDASQDPTMTTFTNLLHLSTHLDSRTATPTTKKQCMEIYFLHQRDTWSPLSASWDMIARLADHYDLSTGFFQILSSFRDRHIATEEGFAGILRSHYTRQRSEFGWVYKYSEKKQVRSGNPWRIRHTGIYHLFDHEQSRTTLFVISPSPAAQFTTYLRNTLQQSHLRTALLKTPMMVHPMLISMHLPSWQDYLEYHETSLLRLDMKSACSALEQPLVTFNTLKEVREVEKNILPLDSLLTTLENLIDRLQEANQVLEQVKGTGEAVTTVIETALTTMRSEVSSYKLQAMYIQGRAQSTAQSVLDSLNLGFQQLAQNQSRNTFVMARSAREDSVAIRAITLVTSFYLPFSFVATMFGMNLVDFDTDTRNLLVSNQFWLYFLVSIPLTAVTLACWRCRMRTYRRGYISSETDSTAQDSSQKNRMDIEMV